MSDLRFLDDLHAEFQRVIATDPRLTNRIPRRHRALASALATGAVVLVALGVLLLAVSVLHHARRSEHPAGQAPPARIVGPFFPGVDAAIRATHGRGACKTAPAPTPRTRAGIPDASLLSTFGVLRHQRTTADMLPTPTSNHSAAMIAAALPYGTYTQGIRRLRTADGTTYYLVPAFQNGTLTSACVNAVIAYAKSSIRRLPARARAEALPYYTFVVQGMGPSPLIALLAIPNRGRPWVSTTTLKQAEQRPLLSLSGRVMTSLVPSSVVRVGIRVVPAQRPGTKPPAPATVSTLPLDNLLIATIPPTRLPVVYHVTWFAADGNAIKSFTQP